MAEEGAERQLVREALDGDRASTRSLVARLRPGIQAELAHLLQGYEPARGRSARQELEDLVQEAFASLWADGGLLLRRWDPARGRSLESYARLVARSRALDALRSRRRMPWREEPTDPSSVEMTLSRAPSPSGRVGARRALWQLQSRLRRELGARDWQLFTSLFTEERGVAQVAEEGEGE